MTKVSGKPNRQLFIGLSKNQRAIARKTLGKRKWEISKVPDGYVARRVPPPAMKHLVAYNFRDLMKQIRESLKWEKSNAVSR